MNLIKESLNKLNQYGEFAENNPSVANDLEVATANTIGLKKLINWIRIRRGVGPLIDLPKSPKKDIKSNSHNSKNLGHGSVGEDTPLV